MIKAGQDIMDNIWGIIITYYLHYLRHSISLHPVALSPLSFAPREHTGEHGLHTFPACHSPVIRQNSLSI